MGKLAKSEVDFWLDTDRYDNYINNDPSSIISGPAFSIDLIKLSSIRKAISNFVRILTRKQIPVYFRSTGDSENYNGKLIYISAKITTKGEFDAAVGLALHEGAHSLLTDFDVILDAWANLPPSILAKSDERNIRRLSIEKFIHRIWNIIEDRYIDNFVFNRAPGYRGYYKALYDSDCHTFQISEILESDDYRWPSLNSYYIRIMNLTNPSSDFHALPQLDVIADLIDLSDIGRLTNTVDRIELAFKVVEIVLDCLDIQSDGEGGNGTTPNQRITPEDFFGVEDEENEPVVGGGGGQVGDKLIGEISDILGGRNLDPSHFPENSDVVDRVSEDNNEELKNQTNQLIKKYHEFTTNQVEKVPLDEKQKSLLDMIEEHGIEIRKVGEGLLGDQTNIWVDCIVVQKMTKNLIFKGSEFFPLSSGIIMGGEEPLPPPAMINAVQKGILLGMKLGRKLHLRTESNPVKSIRKSSGKINRRQLHEAAVDCPNLFYKSMVELHNDAVIHISVDASSSMYGSKWHKTITMVVAICKAASMIDNIHVTVSFRTTHSDSSHILPYVVMAYDSKVDKFSKVKSLFPHLIPNGFTPEGLAFEATMDIFNGITPDEEDKFFLNISDGQPYFTCNTMEGNHPIKYLGETAVNHTKAQVNKIRRNGVQVLSYFVFDESESLPLQALFSRHSSAPNYVLDFKTAFQRMYGKSAQFIDVSNVVEIAKTINSLFLHKEY